MKPPYLKLQPSSLIRHLDASYSAFVLPLFHLTSSDLLYIYFTYFFTVPSHKNVSSTKARMRLSCSLLYLGNYNSAWHKGVQWISAERMKQAAQYVQKLYLVQYHWTTMWERGVNRRWRPVHKEFTLDILDFTNHLEILLKGGFWCSRSGVGPDNLHF